MPNSTVLVALEFLLSWWCFPELALVSATTLSTEWGCLIMNVILLLHLRPEDPEAIVASRMGNLTREHTSSNSIHPLSDSIFQLWWLSCRGLVEVALRSAPLLSLHNPQFSTSCPFNIIYTFLRSWYQLPQHFGILSWSRHAPHVLRERLTEPRAREIQGIPWIRGFRITRSSNYLTQTTPRLKTNTY